MNCYGEVENEIARKKDKNIVDKVNKKYNTNY
jgi:hypothetical protein